MSLFGKMFGKSSSKSDSMASKADRVEYEGYIIEPVPTKEKQNFHTAGYIRKQNEQGQWQEHYFIRADTHNDFKAACDHSVLKGKQIIDECSGRNLFQK